MNTCACADGVHGGRDLQRNDRELARWSWRITDSVDNEGGVLGGPAALLSKFLAKHGLPTNDLARHGANESDLASVTAPAGRFAKLFISAAGSAALIGAAPAQPSPAEQIPDIVAVVYETSPAQHVRRRGRPLNLGTWRSTWTDAEHAAAITTVKSAIAAGDLYQASVVRHFSAPFDGDPGPVLAQIANLKDATYGETLSGDDYHLATATPELLVSVHAGTVTTRPIKGTRAATVAGKAELLTSHKERAEHIMIVDLMRNDLAKVAEFGSVVVEELFVPIVWAGLWQAESVVRARLRPKTGLGELLAAVCPGGSVTGAPKLAALELIAALEPVGRGPAMGALGWLCPHRLDLGLTIRTVAAAGDQLHVWAGGGITHGSDPAAEVAEAVAKAAPLRTMLASAQN